jgi:hypothetical protein
VLTILFNFPRSPSPNLKHFLGLMAVLESGTLEKLGNHTRN